MNDIKRIISDLEQQRSAIERAISALREVAESPAGETSTSTRVAASQASTMKKRQLSPEGRQRIIDAAKKRWAATKRAALKQRSRNVITTE